jgi:cysteine-rich repeat protein
MAKVWLLAVSLLYASFVVLYPPLATAADELIECEAEPTDMPIVLGDIVDCQITPEGDSDIFRFQGTAGEVMIVKLLDLTGGNCGLGYSCPVAQVFCPSSIITPCLTLGAGTDAEQFALTETGEYIVLVIEAGNNQTENYRIALERLFPASPSALAIDFGDVLTDTIDPAPDNDFFLFNGSKDRTVTLTLTDLTGGNCGLGYSCPVAELFGPSRNLIETLGAGTDTTILTLPETGTYTIHVLESGHNQTESYDLALQCLTPPCRDCGNSIIDFGEECDDGNLVGGDGCSANCTIERDCGNGCLDSGEECDDGNNEDGDGCSAVCQYEPDQDEDGDGEADATDLCPGTPPDDKDRVDQAGCSQEQFCSAIDATTKPGQQVCKKSDWRNDQPLKAIPADCKVDLGGSGSADDLCAPK